MYQIDIVSWNLYGRYSAVVQSTAPTLAAWHWSPPQPRKSALGPQADGGDRQL
jgi:phage tail protein X